tara:strand:+ start:2103 stop:4448 length:2346 start_codon:yes stop_codon:yes gene_type:complete
MAITLISNVGFTEINTSGTVNTVAGIKDNLPVQFYKIVSNIDGQLVIDNNDNHKKLILDVNGKTINGQNQSAISYNGNDTLEIKGQGLITSGGTVRVSANGSGSYNATPTLGDGSVVITMTSPNFDIIFNENYTLENEPYRDKHGIRTPDNIPSGETWLGLTGAKGANINGLTANGFSFNNVGTLMSGVTGSVGSFEFYRMTDARRSRSDMGYKAYVWCSTGMFKKGVTNNTNSSSTSNPDYISEPASNPYTGGYYSPQGSRDSGNDHNAYSNHAAMGRLESVSIPTRSFAITNNNTFDISFYSITPPETFVVTVVSGVFYIDGVANPVLNLKRGVTYTFDVSDASNQNHPFRFRDASDASYTTGVTVSGTEGQANATVVIVVPPNAPNTLKYYCTTHGNGMGNTINITSLTENVTASANGGTASLQVYNTNQLWYIEGTKGSTQSLVGNGTGTGTVTSVSGGDGATGNVVVSVANNVQDFPVKTGDEVYAGMEYTPDKSGILNSSQVYPKSYGNTVPVGVSSSAFPNGGMGSAIFSINTDLYSPSHDAANYTNANSRQGRCAARLISDLGSPVRFTYSGAIGGNNFALTGNGASASGTVSGGSATGITTSVTANNSYEFFFTNTSHVLKFYAENYNGNIKWFWSNRPTSANGPNTINRFAETGASYGTTYTMTSVTLPNAGTYTEGKAFAVNNGNDTDISFTGVSTTAIVTASSLTTVTNLNSTDEDWNYTGTRSALNGDGNPLGADPAFGGTGVTNNASGEPTAGIDFSNYTGKYSRTQ